jgi:hypothetical protein
MTQDSAKVAGATVNRVFRLRRLVLLFYVALALIGGLSVAIPWVYEFNDLRPNGRALFSMKFGAPCVLLLSLWPYITSYAVFRKRDEVAPRRYVAYILAILLVCLSAAAAIWYLITVTGQVLLAVAITTIQYMLCAAAATRLLREGKGAL